MAQKYPMRLKHLLSFLRIPGNAFSFWVRRSLRWSRGKPSLHQESKVDLFDHLQGSHLEAEAREAALRDAYLLEPLACLSSRALYRKNLDLLDCLQVASRGLDFPVTADNTVKALDIGPKDWFYVFALERWLRFHGRATGREVALSGIELDAYVIGAGLHSRKDLAEAYLAQTGNPAVRYLVGNFLTYPGNCHDIVFLFYPLVLKHHLLLWGLPLRHFAPQRIIGHAAEATRPGGWLVAFCYSLPEHEAMLKLGRATGKWELLREGALPNLLAYRSAATDRRFSIWKRT